jgi:hypothetical protein
MLLLVLPAGLAAQATHDVNGTLRVEVGEARGDGGTYTDRRLRSYSMALDFARHRDGGSGPLVGFGFTHYQATGHSTGAIGYDTWCPPAAICTAPAPVHRAGSFPGARLGFIDVGWRRASQNFRGDVLLQPTVAFMERPDVAPAGIGGGISVTRRVLGSFGVEIGAFGTYMPALYGDRLGLSQLSVGLRSW